MRWTRFGRTLLAVGGSPTAAPGWARSIPDRDDRLPDLGARPQASVASCWRAASAPDPGRRLQPGAVPVRGRPHRGTSLWGGRANVVGSIVAILLLQIVYTGLVLSGYPERLQPILASILLHRVGVVRPERRRRSCSAPPATAQTCRSQTLVAGWGWGRRDVPCDMTGTAPDSRLPAERSISL